MNQTYQQFGPTAIETLKAARNQVVRAEGPERIRGADKSGNEDEADKFLSGFVPLETDRPKAVVAVPSAGRSLTGFAEEFVQKLTSIEQKKAAVDEEIAKMEKIWLKFIEKKKQLEARRDELTKVKDKLKELDKEISDVLKFQ